MGIGHGGGSHDPFLDCQEGSGHRNDGGTQRVRSGENNPARVLRERVLETAYLWHNYGHPTIGARADIEGVPIERLQKFYHTYYQPDNAALIVTGKFDPKATLAYIEKVFGVIPKPTRILPNLYTAEPPGWHPRSHAAALG